MIRPSLISGCLFSFLVWSHLLTRVTVTRSTPIIFSLSFWHRLRGRLLFYCIPSTSIPFLSTTAGRILQSSTMRNGGGGVELRPLVASSSTIVRATTTTAVADEEIGRRRPSQEDNDDDTPLCCFPLKVLVVVGLVALVWSLNQA